MKRFKTKVMVKFITDNPKLNKLSKEDPYQTPKAAILVVAVFLLFFLVISFTLPFNGGLFSLLFQRSSSHAAGPTVSQYDVFELTLNYPTSSLVNPWEDATVIADFTTPSGKTISQKGFYYDVNTYKVRFPAEELGTYNYTVDISGPTSFTPQTGSFTSVAGSRKGFLHPLANNPYRLGFSDGSLFNELGLNDCFGYGNYQNVDTKNFISSGNAVNLQTYFSTYGSAGFNFLRWSPDNCGFPIVNQISTSGNSYGVPQGQAGDQLIQTAFANNFHIMFTFFVLNQPFENDNGTGPGEQAAIDRYLDYAMARWGAYIDVWEINNEHDPSLTWMQPIINYIHANDPYKRIVTNSFEASNDWTYLDARSPHWYYTESELGADQEQANRINSVKTGSVPVIIGEDGNGTCNWDSTSALRMRERIWSAFFNEGNLVFWNSSYAQNYCNPAANEYIGPEERGYTTVLQNFTNNTDPTVKITQVAQTNSSNIRTWGLSGLSEFLVYLQHYTDHTNNVSTTLNLNLPSSGTATWIDPATGNTLATIPVSAGSQSFTSPSFAIDAALKITYSNSVSSTPTPSGTPTPSPSGYPNPLFNTSVNVSPLPVTYNQSETITSSLTNLYSQTVVGEVELSVINPSDSEVFSQIIPSSGNMQFVTNTPRTNTAAFTLPANSISGTYTIDEKVLGTDGVTVLYDNPSSATFTYTAPSPSPTPSVSPSPSPSFSPSPSSSPAYQTGDVNEDGIVDLGDFAALAIDYGKPMSETKYHNDDVDQDNSGVVDLGDVSKFIIIYRSLNPL